MERKYSVILNLTQHQASAEQVAAGVVDLPEKYRKQLIKLLTFNDIPSDIEIVKRANGIYNLVINFCLDENSPIREEVEELLDKEGHVNETMFKDNFNLGFMIGGALWLMKPLISELSYIGTPLFAFTKRVTEEIKEPDGSITKISKFKHLGFVEAV